MFVESRLRSHRVGRAEEGRRALPDRQGLAHYLSYFDGTDDGAEMYSSMIWMVFDATNVHEINSLRP
jgi:hypothetical protein